MMRRIVGLLLFVASVGAAQADRSSANYSIPADSIDLGGARVQSANYFINGSAVGELGAGSAARSTSPSYADKPGFSGGLYYITGLSITSPPSTSLNENASRQLNAAPLADDGTTVGTLSPSGVVWSVVSGPIASITAAGLATAGTVYQDTAATVKGTAQGLTGQLNLTILNVTSDDFGAYAGDEIDDSWQVQYFGQPPNSKAAPTADPDGDGENNLFEFTAGLIPTDPNSHFILSVTDVAGQSSQRRIVFQPIVGGRTYTVQFTGALTTPINWQPLTGTTQVDNGNQRTVTDPNAAVSKYYQVQISKP